MGSWGFATGHWRYPLHDRKAMASWRFTAWKIMELLGHFPAMLAEVFQHLILGHLEDPKLDSDDSGSGAQGTSQEPPTVDL